jgi:hypothetical protein
MNSELNILNKHFKKMFPFVIEVNGFELKGHSSGLYNNHINLDIYVSAIHYCELLNYDTEVKLSKYMNSKCSYLIKTVIPDWDGTHIIYRFFPDTNEKTILDGLDIS